MWCSPSSPPPTNRTTAPPSSPWTCYFDDGTTLDELAPVDQHGFALTAAGQGESKSLYVEQWNRRTCRIGQAAAGRTVTAIVLRYDNPAGQGGFSGWLDDVRVADVPAPGPRRPSEYVVTTRGTNSNGAFSRGNTIPAAAVPHGFNFWIPVTDASTTMWPYRYQDGNNDDNRPQLQALGISHAPSPWMGDRQTFHFMPSLDPSATPEMGKAARAYPFQHAHEVAGPHYYRVDFDNGLRAELAPTDHAAIARFTFPGRDAALVFDNVSRRAGIPLDPGAGTVSGHVDVRSGMSAGATRMFVHAVLDRPVTGSGMARRLPWQSTAGYLRVEGEPSGPTVLTMRIATSLISVEQARANLAAEIAADDTLEDVRDRAQQAWDDLLGRVEVAEASEDQLITLYSNLYRLFLYPNSAFENTGTAADPDHRYASPFHGRKARKRPERTTALVRSGTLYVNNGFWDTYRTTWPAYALLAPDRAGALVEGFLQHFRDGGWVSRWSSPGYANLMTGTSSDVAFADVYLKGVTGFDVHDAYLAALRNATVTPPSASIGRKGIEQSIFLGYTPTSVSEGLSWTLEGCVNDFGIANLAAALGDTDNELYFRNRALHYVHSFDPALRYFQGRREDGSWRWSAQDYDPTAWGTDYVETDGWNTRFSVPHDGQGLANLYGGRAELESTLDGLFEVPETGRNLGSYHGVVHEMRGGRDVRMGQYAHSNQPSHHILYMYNYAGAPWKTQRAVREILARGYLGSDAGQGYCGDEDNGEMSAWQVFSALGFYPLQVGSQYYVIGSPLYRKATVHLPGGDLVINAPDNSARNVYVQSLHVNGQPWDRTYLPHAVLASGAVLDFRMGPQPSTWGSGADALPPSETTGEQVPRPLRDVTATALVRAGGDVDTDHLFDDTTRTQVRFPHAMTWLDLVLPDPGADVACYTLTSGTGGGDPRSWSLYGSSDGQQWELLDARDGQVFAWRKQTRPFRVDRPGRYRHYRLEITGTADESPLVLTQVELLARP